MSLRTQEKQHPEKSHQAQKSESTRQKIIEAAITCLLKFGYANTTTPLIAEEAGLSRGAMMHHFSNRLNVIQNVIEHLHQKRLVAFRRTAENIDPNSSEIHANVGAYWDHVNHPLFLAFHELTVAARTDADLAAILKPAAAEFNKEWYKLAVQMFPKWQTNKKKFNMALRLSQNLLEGMAINKYTNVLSEEDEEILLDYLKDELRRLRD